MTRYFIPLDCGDIHDYYIKYIGGVVYLFGFQNGRVIVAQIRHVYPVIHYIYYKDTIEKYCHF